MNGKLAASTGTHPAVVTKVLLGALGLYLVAPAFTATHVEAFSALIQSLGLALGSVGVGRQDTAQPFLSELIFYTRQGVSELLHVMNKMFGYSGDLGFRFLTVASLLVLLGSSIRFARDRSGADIRLALACLILTPGIVETGFFFNDNIVSAAFASAAMAVAGPSATALRYGLSGMLFGMAVLCRLDAVFALPFIVGLAISDSGMNARLLARGMAFAAGAIAVTGASCLFTGVSPVDIASIAMEFSRLSKRWMPDIYVHSLVYFFGLVTPLHVVIGAAPDMRDLLLRKRFWYPMTVVIYPVVLAAYAVCNGGREIRYIYPLLAPVIALHGERGLRWMLDHLHAHAGTASRVRVVWLTLLVYALAIPPCGLALRDGPRSLTGHLYMPVIWWRWQQTMTESNGRQEEVVARLGAESRSLVISAHYNDDFFLKLRLMEAGFVDTPVSSRYPGCGGFNIYTRGTREILHVRLSNNWQISPRGQDVVAALRLVRAFDCPIVRERRHALVTTFGDGFSAFDWQGNGLGPPAYEKPVSMAIATDYGRLLANAAAGTGANADVCCGARAGLFSWADLDREQLDAMLGVSHSIVDRAARESGSTAQAMYSALDASVQSRIKRR